MNRRSFLTFAGLSAAALAIGTTAYMTVFKKSENVIAENLMPLYDPAFKTVGENLDAGKVLVKLLNNGVIAKDGSINSTKVAELAKGEEVSDIGGKFYSQTEQELHGLSYIIHNEDMVKLEELDLMGGDYNNYKVADAAACHQACKTDERCTGYTYVKENHDITDKHNMCYLKDGKVKYIVDDRYVSGVR